MAGNYWIDWAEPLTPKIRRVTPDAGAQPTRTLTFNEAREEVADRLHASLAHIERELEKNRRLYADELE